MLGEREAADLERSREYIAAARVHVPEDEFIRRVTTDRIIEPSPKATCPGCSQEYTVGARHACAQLQSLTDALFGPYTCLRCCSYLHRESDHGTGRG